MNDLGAIAGTLLFAGLAGSLHCVGMCGPILLSFSRVFDGTALAADGKARSGSLMLDFGAYHAGRIERDHLRPAEAYLQGNVLAGLNRRNSCPLV